jgi:hypothetical protein
MTVDCRAGKKPAWDAFFRNGGCVRCLLGVVVAPPNHRPRQKGGLRGHA